MLTPVPWFAGQPGRLAWELNAMTDAAPDLVWKEEFGGWEGTAPLWPFDRERPPELADFVGEHRLALLLVPVQSHPAVVPKVWPLFPKPTIEQCTHHRWHTLGDGSLCMMQEYYTWSGAEPCAALIPTAAGWFLEYQLMTSGAIDSMTLSGIEASDELDHLFTGEHHVQAFGD